MGPDGPHRSAAPTRAGGRRPDLAKVYAPCLRGKPPASRKFDALLLNDDNHHQAAAHLRAAQGRCLRDAGRRPAARPSMRSGRTRISSRITCRVTGQEPDLVPGRNQSSRCVHACARGFRRSSGMTQGIGGGGWPSSMQSARRCGRAARPGLAPGFGGLPGVDRAGATAQSERPTRRSPATRARKTRTAAGRRRAKQEGERTLVILLQVGQASRPFKKGLENEIRGQGPPIWAAGSGKDNPPARCDRGAAKPVRRRHPMESDSFCARALVPKLSCRR